MVDDLDGEEVTVALGIVFVILVFVDLGTDTMISCGFGLGSGLIKRDNAYPSSSDLFGTKIT